MRKFCYCLFVIFSFSSFSSCAQQLNSTLDKSVYGLSLEQLMQLKTVSIATGRETKLDKSPAVAAVITREEIELMSADTVFDLLETITGFHVYPNKINRMNPLLSIRGINTSENPQVLVLINGQRQSRVYTGSRWNQFNIGVDIIERIEVIRGPNSALYGADAFAGVVNIITFGVQSDKATLFGAKTGAFDTQSVWFSTTNQYDQLKYSFSGQWRDTAGDKSRIVDSDYADAIGFSDISLTPRALDTRLETIDLQLQLQYQDNVLMLSWLKNDGGTGAGAAQALSDGDIDVVRVFTARFSKLWQLNDDLSLNWQSYYQNHNEFIRFEILPAGFIAPNGFDQNGEPTGFVEYVDGMIGMPLVTERYLGSKMVVQYQPHRQHDFRFEFGWHHEAQLPRERKNFGPGVIDENTTIATSQVIDITDTPYIYINENDREFYFLMMQYQWALSDEWDVIIGARLDEYSDSGSTFNPRVGSVWQINPRLSAKLLYGEAFRPPAFSELFSLNNPIVEGNPNLEPEKIKMLEYTFDYQWDSDWHLKFGLFNYKMDEVIEWIAQS